MQILHRLESSVVEIAEYEHARAVMNAQDLLDALFGALKFVQRIHARDCSYQSCFKRQLPHVEQHQIHIGGERGQDAQPDLIVILVRDIPAPDPESKTRQYGGHSPRARCELKNLAPGLNAGLAHNMDILPDEIISPRAKELIAR